MKANYNIAVGTQVAFGPASRLRRIVVDERTKVSRFREHEMHEGALIGEGRKGKIVARVEELNKIAYVVETDTGHFGWVYNFEFNVL